MKQYCYSMKHAGFATAPSFKILSPGKCCHCLARHQDWILTEHP